MVYAKKYSGNKMLGRHEIIDGKLRPYVRKTNYKEVYTEALHIGFTLRAAGAEP
ncbi:hypothetical protein FRX31_019534, partial [Thalictrum thalictroides]